MSRIGKKPIAIPAGVEVKVEGQIVTVKGPKGQLTHTVHPDMQVSIEDSHLLVKRPSDDKPHRALHGTTRSVIDNMVTGVTEGFQKELELVGVGYRAAKSGNGVTLNVGYSHPVEVPAIDGIEFEVPSQTQIIIKGIDKEVVGEVAAKIRAVRKPEPYKGKGIKYKNEHIRRKEGKTGK
ncbi:50S ribosomal protein L6 [Rubeoparvulum massiliense]|uniref:50S ribosomal protein L6 n=1 Tax=Rubeoparvulum massiliense TaxID=1631346 RepID=UPI00065E8211|nr:50S ribosomal protein L6 [Rubeoparvulum massiliense]